MAPEKRRAIAGSVRALERASRPAEYGIATSWRSTSSSASFDAAERASSAIQPVRWTNIKWSIRTVTSPRYCHRAGWVSGWSGRIETSWLSWVPAR